MPKRKRSKNKNITDNDTRSIEEKFYDEEVSLLEKESWNAKHKLRKKMECVRGCKTSKCLEKAFEDQIKYILEATEDKLWKDVIESMVDDGFDARALKTLIAWYGDTLKPCLTPRFPRSCNELILSSSSDDSSSESNDD